MTRLSRLANIRGCMFHAWQNRVSYHVINTVAGNKTNPLIGRKILSSTLPTHLESHFVQCLL
jgi:hypothetical protein